MGGVTGDGAVPLARLLAMTYRWMIDQLHERLAATGWVGIRPAYGFVLLLARDGPMTPTVLAARLEVSKQAASKLAEAMVTDGLLSRAEDEHDGRQLQLTLSRRGRQLLSAVEEIYRDLETELGVLVGERALGSARRTLAAVVVGVSGGRLPDIRPDHLT